MAFDLDDEELRATRILNGVDKEDEEKEETLSETEIRFRADLLILNSDNSYKGQFKRQQKEIEELKEKEKMFLEDKIKAKIEPVLKQLETKMKEEYNQYGNSREYQDIVDAYNFLQSLLEKE